MGDINFTEEQVEVIRSCCERVCNSSTHIPSVKLLHIIQLLGQNPSQAKIKSSLHAVGLSKKDNVDFNELLAVITNVWAEEDTEFELLQAFQKIDKAGNGCIETEEFKRIMLNYGESLTLKELEDMMSMFNTNNHLIYYEEFVKAIVEGQQDEDENQDEVGEVPNEYDEPQIAQADTSYVANQDAELKTSNYDELETADNEAIVDEDLNETENLNDQTVLEPIEQEVKQNEPIDSDEGLVDASVPIDDDEQQQPNEEEPVELQEDDAVPQPYKAIEPEAVAAGNVTHQDEAMDNDDNEPDEPDNNDNDGKLDAFKATVADMGMDDDVLAQQEQEPVVEADAPNEEEPNAEEAVVEQD